MHSEWSSPVPIISTPLTQRRVSCCTWAEGMAPLPSSSTGWTPPAPQHRTGTRRREPNSLHQRYRDLCSFFFFFFRLLAFNFYHLLSLQIPSQIKIEFYYLNMWATFVTGETFEQVFLRFTDSSKPSQFNRDSLGLLKSKNLRKFHVKLFLCFCCKSCPHLGRWLNANLNGQFVIAMCRIVNTLHTLRAHCTHRICLMCAFENISIGPTVQWNSL